MRRRSQAIPMIVIYVLAALGLFTGTSVALDYANAHGIVHINATNPMFQFMQSYAEHVEGIFAMNKTAFHQYLMIKHFKEGYEIHHYCDRYCHLYYIQLNNSTIPAACRTYCYIKTRHPSMYHELCESIKHNETEEHMYRIVNRYMHEFHHEYRIEGSSSTG